jgi:hypothetical protein
LTTCRTYDGGPIPWTAIRDYADDNELDDLRETFVEIIMGCDIEWRMKNRPKGPGPGGKGKIKGAK